MGKNISLEFCCLSQWTIFILKSNVSRHFSPQEYIVRYSCRFNYCCSELIFVVVELSFAVLLTFCCYDDMQSYLLDFYYKGNWFRWKSEIWSTKCGNRVIHWITIRTTFVIVMFVFKNVISSDFSFLNFFIHSIYLMY